jgi:hypothetical protein
MPERYSKKERNIAAGETAAGVAIGGAAVSGKVPEIVNSWARRGRKTKYEETKGRVSGNDKRTDGGKGKVDFNRGMGYDKEKGWTKLHNLPEDSVRDVEHKAPDGRVFPGKEKVTPRKDAWNAAWDKHDRAKNTLESKTNVPFPESEWEYDQKGKKLKVVPKREPATKEPIRSKNGKVKMTISPAQVGHTRRAAVMGVGIPVGLGLAWQGSRTLARQNELSKAMTRGEVDGAVVGGSIGGALYQAPSFTEWGLRSKDEKKLKKKNKHQRIIQAWKDEYKINGLQRGDPRWTEAYHNYPKNVPGGPMRRTMSYTHAGKSGMALTAGAVAGGAAVGTASVRSTRKRRQRKAQP